MSFKKLKAMLTLENTIEKLRADIEALQKEGKYPHDYSLGFTNGVIFVHHRIKGLPGQPKFYDQKMSIGEMPRPIKFEHEIKRDIEEEKKYEELVDQILIDAQVLANKFPESQEAVALMCSLGSLNTHIDNLLLKEEKKA